MPRASATQHELARVELLAGLPGEVLHKLAKQMEREEVAPGTAIVREGEPGERFYVLFAGMLSMTACNVRYNYLHHGAPPNPGTPTGTYGVTVNAVSANEEHANAHDHRSIRNADRQSRPRTRHRRDGRKIQC